MATPILITGGRVFTADPANPWAEAVVVDGSELSYVGDRASASVHAGPDAEVIDAVGGLIMPGFVDGHVHVAWTGADRGMLQLRDAERLFGASWVHAAVPNGRPTRTMIDEVVSDRPVYLQAYDFHSS